MAMALPIKKTDRILIVAPHADDESIGCGGLMTLYGKQCDILLLTDGRKGYDSQKEIIDEETLVQTRETELKRVAQMCGVRRIIKLQIPDGTVCDHQDTVLSVDITGYDLIFVPNQQERHKDHSVVAQLFLKMKKKQKAHAAMFEYEVWSPLPTPTVVLDISEIIEFKENLVSQYQSQIKYKDYVRMTRGLNQYRGVGFDMEYAEVYAPLIYRSFVKSVYGRLPYVIRKCIQRILRK